MQMSDPTFWDDPDKAKKISQEATLLKTEVEGHEELVRKADDLSDYLENGHGRRRCLFCRRH